MNADEVFRGVHCPQCKKSVIIIDEDGDRFCLEICRHCGEDLRTENVADMMEFSQGSNPYPSKKEPEDMD